MILRSFPRKLRDQFITSVIPRLKMRLELLVLFELISVYSTQSSIIGAVRGAHSQLWRTIIHVYSPCAPRKHDKRFGTPVIV